MLIGTYLYYYRLNHKRLFCDNGYEYEGIVILKKDDKITILTKHLRYEHELYDLHDQYDDILYLNEKDLYNNKSFQNMTNNIAKISLSLYHFKNNENIKNILCQDLLDIISEFIYNDFKVLSTSTYTTYFEIYDLIKSSNIIKCFRSPSKKIDLLDTII